MKAEEFYKQKSNSTRELWALSPKQIEYIGLIMEEYAALRQPPVSGELPYLEELRAKVEYLEGVIYSMENGQP